MVTLLATLLTALALTAFGQNHEVEILRLIEEVKKAPPSERYKIMNELKIKLREMSRREREEMIREVYEKLKGGEMFEKGEHFEEKYEEHEKYEQKEKYEQEFEDKFERDVEKEEHKFESREGKEHMEEKED